MSKNSQIYFARELLCNTLEGRRVDLLTITSYKDLLFEREPELVNEPTLFPHLKIIGQPRPYKARKPVILISARVHPGEVPSSHILKGLLDFLQPQEAKGKMNSRDEGNIDPRAMAFLNNFVLKIVPMLNPDGVARGHYRFDTLG